MRNRRNFRKGIQPIKRGFWMPLLIMTAAFSPVMTWETAWASGYVAMAVTTAPIAAPNTDSITAPITAPAWPECTAIEADGAILMDADTGTVLYGKNISNAYYPASITKLLTAQLVLDHANLDEMVTFSREAVYDVEEGSKSLGMEAGDQMTVRDCLYGLLLHSANEVANALAEHVAGNREAFAEMMNEKAAALGCTGSNFANPSGLNSPDHYTTAYDMALISRNALNYPELVEIMGTRAYAVPASKREPGGQMIFPGHKMLKKNQAEYDSKVFGGKTGYTSLAGNTLVTYAVRDDMTLIAVILNGHLTHYSDTKKLLDFGYGQFQTYRLAGLDTVYKTLSGNLEFAGLESEKPLLLLHGSSRIVLPKNAGLSDTDTVVTYDKTVWTPADTVVTVDYLYEGKMVGHAFMTANPETETQPLGMAFAKSALAETEPDQRFKGRLIYIPAIALIILTAAGLTSRRRREAEIKNAAARKHRREQLMQESGCAADELDHLLLEGRQPFWKKRRH